MVFQANPEIIYISSNNKGLVTFFDNDERMFEISELLHEVFKLLTSGFTLEEIEPLAQAIYTGPNKDELSAKLRSFQSEILELKLILPVDAEI